MDENKDLTPRQELFCQEYVTDYNATQAAIRAGYKENAAYSQASRLLRNVKVLARVRELQHEQLERLAISQDYVILQLLDTYNCCRDASAVLAFDPVAKQMEETGQYHFDSKGAIRALELIGKHLGMFDDRLRVSGTLNTGQLDKVISQLRGGSSG